MSIAFDNLDYYDETGYNNVMIVDSLNIAFRYKHASTKQFAAKYFATINSLAKSYKAKQVFVVGDLGSEWRYSIYPDYKANRKELREKQTEEEAKEFDEFLEEYKKALEICAGVYPVLKYSGVEADDLAAFIVKELDPNTYDHIWLISSDKDWDQLISEKVSRFSTVTRKEITFNNWNEHYDYDINQHLDIKVLMGDKSDNVKGIDGVGEKRAYNLLRSYGPTAIDVSCHLPIDSSLVYIKNLNLFGEDNILKNCELMDLKTYCYDAIGEHLPEIEKIVEDFNNENRITKP